MESRIVSNGEKIWVKNGQIHLSGEVYEAEKLKKVIVQVSDLTFLEDTVRLMLVFENGVLIVPSMHPSYDGLFEKLNKLVKIDNNVYLKAMNCDVECDFVIFER